ncbi:MAG TPA: gas vesicle protein [Chloroflexota bacterium]|nr:gas vesicle protein [Chloroflexota bacterium]
MIPEFPEFEQLERRGMGSLGGALPGLAEEFHDGEFSVLELADRLLHKGVVLVGEATISVAGVDLIYLGLNVVLTSVENLLPKDEPPASAE